MEKTESDSIFRKVPSSEAVDPATDWSFGADCIHGEWRNPKAFYPVSVRLKSGRMDTLEQRVREFVDAVNKSRSKAEQLRQPRLLVSDKYKSADTTEITKPELPGDEIFSFLTDEALFPVLRAAAPDADTEHPAEDLFILGHGDPLPDHAAGAVAARMARPLPNKPPKRGMVVTAVIDTGIPFLNRQFCDASGQTRVYSAWVQDGRTRPSGQNTVQFGREFSSAQINDLLQTYSAGRPVTDELAAYRQEGLADFTDARTHSLGFAMTHGAHVASAAAGYPPEANKTDNPLIFVQLPDMVVADASGASLEPYLIAAVEHILTRADDIAIEQDCGQLPLVINFSFGGTGGPLDGTSAIEQYLDAVIARRNQRAPGQTAMVLPAGNAYLSQCHAKCTQGVEFQGPDQTETLTWQIQPDDHTASFVEIWTPKRHNKNAHVLKVSLAKPYSNTFSPELGETPGFAVEILDDQTQTEVVARIAYTWVGPPTNRGKFTIAVQATANPGTECRLAPSGPWKLRLRDVGLPEGAHVDAWIQRDDELPRFDTDARQSRFIDPRYRHWTLTPNGYPEQQDQPGCPVIRAGLQNALATGEETIVIGGYIDKSGALAEYTAGGPTNTPDRPGPDAVTVSDDSEVHWGVLSGLVLSGGRFPANGTSMSAPAVARALAERLSADGPTFQATRATVAQMAIDSETSGVFTHRAPKPPIARGGAGRIELQPQSNRRYQP